MFRDSEDGTIMCKECKEKYERFLELCLKYTKQAREEVYGINAVKPHNMLRELFDSDGENWTDSFEMSIDDLSPDAIKWLLN